MDLAKAHVVALERLLNNSSENNYDVFNLGTGQGNSVTEVINTFEKSTGQKLPFKIADRREGDIIAAYADTKKANNILNWKAEHGLDEALNSAWKWEKKVKEKEEKEKE
jgi:UDP-glucose 4-epimerase